MLQRSMTATENSIVARNWLVGVKFSESYSLHTNMRDHHIGGYYTASEMYWAEAVYQ
jgi:hypothetical protein